MIIGKYRITRRGYVVFGAFGIALLLTIGSWVQSAFAPQAEVQDVGQSQTQTGESGTGANLEAANGAEETSVANGNGSAGAGTAAELSVSEKNQILKASTATVYFPPNVYELDERFYKDLDQIVQTALRFKESRIKIDGHYNGYPDFPVSEFWTSLAQNRAEMVAAYFVSQGIDQDRLVIGNLGCSVPVNQDDSWQEIQKNRRVEVYFEPFAQ